MKKLFLLCFAVCLTVVVSAQKVYFLYLQTDDQSPFYVRMADKIYSSSTAGYLILPNLTDSTYSLAVGFPQKAKSETRFAVTINQNDKGYLVKNFSDGLALFDVEELSIVKSASVNNGNTVYETKTDKFSSVLSKAADDPSLLKVPVAKKEEPKPKVEEKEVVTAKAEEPKPAEEKPKEPAVVKVNETVNPKAENTQKPEETKPEVIAVVQPKSEQKETESKTETVTMPPAEYKPSTIVRRSESSTTEGFGIVFFDRNDERTDTIRILIPAGKGKIDQDTQTANLSEVEKKSDNTPASTDPPKTEVKLLPIDAPPAEQKDQPTAKQSAPVGIVAAPSCKESASDKDFMKLRKNMAAKETDEAMIDEAKKVYRNRCFTVEQLRYLSTLFLTSAAKYQFFDASYNHVSDKQNFTSLQSEIKDEYYLKRFKALAGE